MLPLLASLSLAHASGIMSPPSYKFVGEDCDAIGLEEPWPASRPVRFAGHNEGYTSPPGGPLTQHIFPVRESAMVLRRVDCETAVGQWVEAGRSCGPAPVLAWQGSLEPGAQYVVDIEGSTVFTIDVAGKSRPSACPAPPSTAAAAPYQSRSVSTVTWAVTLPDDVVKRHGEPEWVDLSLLARELSTALGYPDLRSTSEQSGSLSVPPKSPPTGSARISRSLDVAEQGTGDAVHCVMSESVEVELSLDGVDRVFLFESARELGDNPGACPR